MNTPKYIYHSLLLSRFVRQLPRRKFLLGTSSFFITVLIGNNNSTKAQVKTSQLVANNKEQVTVIVARKSTKPDGIAIVIAGDRIMAVGSLASVKNSLENRSYTLQENINTKNLVLANNMIASNNIGLLFKSLLANQSLNIQIINLTTTNESCVIKGRASLFLIADAEVEAKFYLKNQIPEMILTVSLPKNWKFTQSFPDLGVTLLTRMGLKEEGFLLDKVTYKQPKLILDSVEIGDPKYLPSIKFEAGLPVENNLLPLKQFIGNVQPLPLAGYIVPTIKGTEVFLSTTVPKKNNLGYLPLPFIEFYLIADVVTDTYKGQLPYTNAYFAVETKIEVGSKDKPVSIPIYSTFRNRDDDLTFEADLEKFSLMGLSQLTSLMNGTALMDLLPSNYRPEKGGSSEFSMPS